MGLKNSDMLNVYVESTPPTPQFTITPTNKWQYPSEFFFDAKASNDIDVGNGYDKLTYDWSFSNPSAVQISETEDNNKKISGNVRTEYGSRGSYKYGLSTIAKATDKLTFKVDYSRDRYRSERDSDENGKVVSRSQEVSIDIKYKFDNADLTVKYTRNEKHRADGGDLEETNYYKNRKKKR